MKKFISLILLACILLSLITTLEALPSVEKRTNTCKYKRNVLGKRTNVKKCPCTLAETVFDDAVKGIVVYAQDECGSTTITGQFSKGFEDPSKNYTFLIVDKCGYVIRDLTHDLAVPFSGDGGSKAFNTKIYDLNLNCDENGILNKQPYSTYSNKRTCNTHKYSKRDPGDVFPTYMRINENGDFYAEAAFTEI